MTDTPQQVVAEILERGLLNIRFLGWEGDAAACGVEADHIHNLPRLLREWSNDELERYLEADAKIYAEQADARAPYKFDDLWAQLTREVLAGK